MTKTIINLAIVDDHTLFRKGLVNLIQSLGSEYKVIMEAGSGDQFLDQLNNAPVIPDLAVIDVNMPRRDGFETVIELQKRHPLMPVLIVSMIDNESSVVKMLKLGVKGYLSKDVEPNDLRAAITAIFEKGYYYTDFITGRLVHQLQKAAPEAADGGVLSEKEIDFLKLAATELTYKQIADQMNLTFKSIDNLRENLFKKLGVTSRVGLVIYAFKNDMIYR